MGFVPTVGSLLLASLFIIYAATLHFATLGDTY
jgi:hypothetical protein